MNESKQNRLHITSDSMEVEKSASIVHFSGHVVVTQQTTTLHADAITITLYSDAEKKELSNEKRRQSIKTLVASGNVKYISDRQKAFADKATYTAEDQKLVLTGENPKVLTGESYVTGKKITLFQNSGKVIVEGDTVQRVEALFNSEDSGRLEGTL